MTHTITVSHTISMGHRLPSYRGICSSPHGHNVKVDVVIEHRVNEFFDFKKVSDKLKEVLEPLDHAMVLAWNDPLVDTLRSMDFRVYIMPVEPSTEAIALMIHTEMKMLFRVFRTIVHETDKYSATVTE